MSNFIFAIFTPRTISKESVDFFRNVKNLLQENISKTNPHIILCGDFNMIFDTSLHCFGGNQKIKGCVKIVNDVMVMYLYLFSNFCNLVLKVFLKRHFFIITAMCPMSFNAFAPF